MVVSMWDKNRFCDVFYNSGETRTLIIVPQNSVKRLLAIQQLRVPLKEESTSRYTPEGLINAILLFDKNSFNSFITLRQLFSTLCNSLPFSTTLFRSLQLSTFLYNSLQLPSTFYNSVQLSTTFYNSLQTLYDFLQLTANSLQLFTTL